MRRRGFTLAELLVSVGVASLLTGLALPAVQRARRAAARATCAANLRQFGLALHSYESANGRFPAAGPPPWNSWESDLGPHLESRGPARALRCPSKAHKSPARGDYSAADAALDGALARGGVGLRAGDVADGLSATLAFGEMWVDPAFPDVANSFVGGEWYALALRSAAVPPYPDGAGPQPAARRSFGGPHGGGVVAAFADGSAHVVSYAVAPAVWRAYGTRAGGECVAAP